MINEKLREEFEKWYSPLFSIAGAWCDTDYAKSLAWEAWQAAHKSTVPGGYCIVPVKTIIDSFDLASSVHGNEYVGDYEYELAEKLVEHIGESDYWQEINQ